MTSTTPQAQSTPTPTPTPTSTPTSTKTATATATSTSPPRERRPFQWIRAVGRRGHLTKDYAEGLVELELRVAENVQIVVRALVNYTVSSQNRRSRAAGRSGGTSLSILNRRRRSARAWILAILAGRVDDETLRALTHTWLPQLAGTGPDIELAVAAGTEFLEFMRGAITALVMTGPAESLVPEAKALHALETVLGIHLQAVQDVVRVVEVREI